MACARPSARRGTRHPSPAIEAGQPTSPGSARSSGGILTSVRLELGEEGVWDAAASTIFTSAREARVPEQVAGICALTGVRPPAAVLDLACGVGRHAVVLATLGFSVTGVDLTPSFLEEAARRVSEAGVRLDLVCADMY